MDGLRPAWLSMLHVEPGGDLVQEPCRRFGGPLIANSAFGAVPTREEAVRLIGDAHVEAVAVAVGRPVLADPTSSSAGGANTRRTSRTR